MGHDKDQLGTTEWNLGEIRIAKFVRSMCVAFEKIMWLQSLMHKI